MEDQNGVPGSQGVWRRRSVPNSLGCPKAVWATCCRRSPWKAPGRHPPSSVLISSVRCAPRLSTQLEFPALAEAAWHAFLRRSAKLPGTVLVKPHHRVHPQPSPAVGLGCSSILTKSAGPPQEANFTLFASPPRLPQSLLSRGVVCKTDKSIFTNSVTQVSHKDRSCAGSVRMIF